MTNKGNEHESTIVSRAVTFSTDRLSPSILILIFLSPRARFFNEFLSSAFPAKSPSSLAQFYLFPEFLFLAPAL